MDGIIYNTLNTSQFNIAVFFDSSSNKVKKITWPPSQSNNEMTIKNVKQHYPAVEFKKIEKWFGPPKRGSHIYFESKNPNIVVTIDPTTELQQ